MYTFVAKQDSVTVEGRMSVLTPLEGQPSWARDGSTCNSWLFVNNGGTQIDYATDDANYYEADGFDF